MSLSQPKLKNPCSKFMEFKGETKTFRYYDKEKKENVTVNPPLKFIVLDELNTVGGWSEENASGIYSNEVKNMMREPMNVRTFKGGVSFTGLYKEIQGDIKALGGRFIKSVYVALIHGDELELANIQMKGASFSSWIECELDKQKAVECSSFTEGKKGKVTFAIPAWKNVDISPALMEKAVGMDKELQTYLKAYLKNNEAHESVQPDAKEDDQIPFN